MTDVINGTGSEMYDVTTQLAPSVPAPNRILIGVEVFALVLIWVLSVIGNVFVCVVINRSRRIQSTTNYFVISLACADLILAFLSMPFVLSGVAANQWILGNSVCKFVRFVQYLVPCVNMYILVCIAIDRFYTIIYPLSFKVTKGTAKRMITCCWFSSVAVSGVCFYFFDSVTVVGLVSKEVCPSSIPRDWLGRLFIVFVFSLEVVLPTAFLLICYIRVFRYIWQIHLGSRLFHRTMNPVPRTKVKVVKMLMVVTLTSVASYVPFYVTQVWYSFSESTPPSWFYVMVGLTVCSTGVSKPLVYLCYNSNFRRGCKEVLCMSAMRCYRSNTYAITSTSAIGKKNHIGIMEMGTSDSMCTTPSKVFNRSILLEQSVWPIPSPTASTYI